MSQRSDLINFVFGAATLTGLAQFVFSIFGKGSIFEGPINVQKVLILLATFLISGTIAYIVVYAKFKPWLRPKLLRDARYDTSKFADKCAVPGALFLDIAEHFPKVSYLDAEKNHDARFSLIAKHNELDAAAAALELQRTPQPKRNHEHLILSQSPRRLDEEVTGWWTHYQEVKALTALRATKGIKPNRPKVLSANALLIDWSKGKVGLQIRAPDVETFPGCLHVFGGGFEPGHDNKSIALAAQREVTEETEGSATVSVSDCITILQHETETNYYMVVFLGAQADSKTAIKNNEEGILHWFPFEEIPDILAGSKYDWVCTGKQALLAWLEIGCPVGGKNSVIGLIRSRMLLWKYRRRALISGAVNGKVA